MDGNITINIYALGFFILLCLVAVVCVYLIITLRNFNRLVGKINGIADENRENINRTMAILPEVTKNVNDVAVGVKENLSKAGSIIDTLDGAVTETVATVSEGTENILSVIEIASSVIKAIMNVFSSDRKD